MLNQYNNVTRLWRRFDLHTENIHRQRRNFMCPSVKSNSRPPEPPIPTTRLGKPVASGPPEHYGGCKKNNINIHQKHFWCIRWLNRTASWLNPTVSFLTTKPQSSNKQRRFRNALILHDQCGCSIYLPIPHGKSVRVETSKHTTHEIRCVLAPQPHTVSTLTGRFYQPRFERTSHVFAEPSQ